ncbi:chemotaxis protein CheW [Psychromonas sp. CD1]|uniref:chemotaxis protein CheW n=1 Tax=Psychromonas sp. CD1 TaxID=1979839 RepID=UPI000B9A4388|nr:chemotaxis protein CheW [Psychromonas sp. CD1]
MKNHNDEAMHAYFNALLSESEVKPTQEDIVEENLSVNNSIFNRDLSFAPKIITDVRTEPSINKDDNWQNLQVECEFQVLFFKFSGLHFAVPLIDIAGIHALDNPLNQLLGKPNWFYGVMTHQDKLYNLVDSAQWMNMEKSGKTLNYSHYIILGNSGWGYRQLTK